MSAAQDDLPQLLAKIQADPDNDDLRLLLADWYQQHGDPDRAEFIRLQIAWAQEAQRELFPGESLQRDLLSDRATELELQHRKRWLGDKAILGNTVRFQRGLAEGGHCAAVSNPLAVRSLDVRSSSLSPAGLAHLPQLSNLRRLDLDGCVNLTDESAASLARPRRSLIRSSRRLLVCGSPRNILARPNYASRRNDQ